MTGGPTPDERHTPVLLDRIRELLAPALRAEGAVLVDATLGLAGHASALLADCPGARLVGLDRDPQALAAAADRLAPFGDRVTTRHTVFDGLAAVLADLGIGSVAAVLFDLGVSSLQIDSPGRGFSYAQDAPLDMRMDPGGGPTAADVLNGYDVRELTRVFREYGEERLARRIAEAVVARRAVSPLSGSADLVELIRDSIPAPARRTGGHPAKRVFQALRIEVNGELAALRRAVPDAVAALGVGGRIAVLSYHSLEDRIVKRDLAAGAADATPPGLPVRLAEAAPQLRLLTRGAEPAGAAETDANPRASSVRLRAAERVRAAS